MSQGIGVTVRLFAWLRDAAQRAECRLQLASGASGLDVKAELLARWPGLREALEPARLAVNCEYQSWDVRLTDGDELAVIPPVSGGC